MAGRFLHEGANVFALFRVRGRICCLCDNPNVSNLRKKEDGAAFERVFFGRKKNRGDDNGGKKYLR